MGLLASALPGFREIRAPLVAGYLWLLLVWIVVAPDVPLAHHLETHGLGAIADLTDLAGPIATAAAVGVLAYVLGMVSRPIATALAELARLALSPTPLRIKEPLKESELPGRPADEVRRPWTESAVGLYPVAGTINGLEVDNVWQDANDHERQRLIRIAEQCADEVDRSVELPASLLLASQTGAIQTFGEVDRLVAEAEFRVLVAPPILALAVTLAATANITWLLLALATPVLVVQGLTRRQDARRIMVQFVAYRTVMTAPPLTTFESALNEVRNTILARRPAAP